MLQGDAERAILWDDVFNEPSAHAVVRKIEDMSPLGKPWTTPATSPYSVTFRIIAKVLGMQLDDRQSWNAIEINVNPAGPDRLDPLISGFPSVIGALARKRSELGQEQAIQPYLWAVVRDVEPLFVLDTDGYVHTKAGSSLSTMALYHHGSRELAAVAGGLIDLAIKGN